MYDGAEMIFFWSIKKYHWVGGEGEGEGDSAVGLFKCERPHDGNTEISANASICRGEKSKS